MRSDCSDRLTQILSEIKGLAQEYHLLTGKPLGVTGEIAEAQAVKYLGLELCVARQVGYDAVRHSMDGTTTTVQIKGKSFEGINPSGLRMGKINLSAPFDVLVLVLLNRDLHAREMWEADREAITKLLTNANRTDPGILQFMKISKKVWTAP